MIHIIIDSRGDSVVLMQTLKFRATHGNTIFDTPATLLWIPSTKTDRYTTNYFLCYSHNLINCYILFNNNIPIVISIDIMDSSILTIIGCNVTILLKLDGKGVFIQFLVNVLLDTFRNTVGKDSITILINGKENMSSLVKDSHQILWIALYLGSNTLNIRTSRKQFSTVRHDGFKNPSLSVKFNLYKFWILNICYTISIILIDKTLAFFLVNFSFKTLYNLFCNILDSFSEPFFNFMQLLDKFLDMSINVFPDRSRNTYHPFNTSIPLNASNNPSCTICNTIDPFGVIVTSVPAKIECHSTRRKHVGAFKDRLNVSLYGTYLHLLGIDLLIQEIVIMLTGYLLRINADMSHLGVVTQFVINLGLSFTKGIVKHLIGTSHDMVFRHIMQPAYNGGLNGAFGNLLIVYISHTYTLLNIITTQCIHPFLSSTPHRLLVLIIPAHGASLGISVDSQVLAVSQCIIVGINPSTIDTDSTIAETATFKGEDTVCRHIDGLAVKVKVPFDDIPGILLSHHLLHQYVPLPYHILRKKDIVVACYRLLMTSCIYIYTFHVSLTVYVNIIGTALNSAL